MSTTVTPVRWLKAAIADKRIEFIPIEELADEGSPKLGGYGSVQPAHWGARDRKVAVKSVFNVGAGTKAYANFKREVEILLKVNDGRYAVPFLGLTQDDESLQYMMVFQLADGGNLEEYLQNNESSLTWPTRIRLATDVTEGLAHIHSHGILHKDLHSGNILIHDGRALIADFGCSRPADYDGTRTDFVGRVGFGAPEKLRDRKEHVYNAQCDIYSLGGVFWNISSGRAPFSTTPDWEVVGKVCNGEREEPVPGTPPLYVQLYTACWQNDPCKRPEMQNILSRLTEISQSLLSRPMEVVPQSTPTGMNLQLPISDSHILLIEGWMSKNGVAPLTPSHTWTLLYRGSRDGFRGVDFHRCCDLKGPTVTIVQPHGVDRLIGGFNSKRWESWSGRSRAPGSFIYSIGNGVNNTFVSRLRDEYVYGAIYNNRECGPLFGWSDLRISNECNQKSLSYCRSFTYDRQLMEDVEKDEDGNVKFKVEEIEVYGVK